MKSHTDFKIIDEYQRIMIGESRIANTNSIPASSIFLTSPMEVYNLTEQIAEIAKSSLLPRGYIERYGLDDSNIAYESIAAHTNLAMALVDRALSYYYGPNFGEPSSEWPCTIDGYSYREIMEAIRIHDLPENDIGDWPDNDSTNGEEKSRLEQRYLQRFYQTYSHHEQKLGDSATRLFKEMDNSHSVTGRLLHLADKTAAIIITLCYDDAKAPPLIHRDNPTLSERDRQEMEICDWHKNGFCKASEMWTVDHFRIRKPIELDDDGFFTAIIVMYTLMVNGKWYSWREEDYQN